MSGILVVVEGPEGAGKSTLVQGVAQRVRQSGADPVLVREPGGTPVAEAARKVFLDPELDTGPVAELFLVLAARADLVANILRPALEAGRIVISDRYDYSTMAYQVIGRGLDRHLVAQANTLATGGLRPDLTIVLDVPAGVGRERQAQAQKRPDRIELAEDDMHERVARFFADLQGEHIVHVDGTRPAVEVEQRAWELMAPLVRETIGARAGLK